MAGSQSEKLDLFKLHKGEYVKPKKPALIETGPAQYIVVRGTGAPGSEPFTRALEALYPMAYTLKFESKFAGRDYTVGKLEALYGVDGQTLEQLGTLPKDRWNWHMMIRVPDFTTGDDLGAARQKLRDKGKEGDFDAVTLETLDEGRCVQMLHLGPYEDLARSAETMLSFAAESGLAPRSWHHDIYLSDPRRVAPEKLKTIVRLPVR
ncbi:hypothetical protein ABI59_17795 [Acidobacteria bacterium Mor1]|nr:hypothetical protein ABI59_17795 [Acidobacteria bacterium Mor1]